MIYLFKVYVLASVAVFASVLAISLIVIISAILFKSVQRLVAHAFAFWESISALGHLNSKQS